MRKIKLGGHGETPPKLQENSGASIPFPNCPYLNRRSFSDAIIGSDKATDQAFGTANLPKNPRKLGICTGKTPYIVADALLSHNILCVGRMILRIRPAKSIQDLV
jgi:hypothetical protein